MSEKVNFLNLNETKDIKNTTTNKTVAESKKEGMSLFDSLLANSTKENKKSEEKSSTNTKTLSKKEEITTEKKDLELKKNSSKAEEKSEVSSKKTVESKPQETAQKETALKDENTQENKKPAKKTTGSLLDRLVLEANKKINKKEEIAVKDNSLDSSSVDEKRNTQKQASLFDTLKQENKETKEAKKEIVENKDLKEDTKEIKKSEKNRLEETKNDKNLKEIKGKIETKEEKTEQVKDTSLEENKESKENKEIKEAKKEIVENKDLKEDTKEIKKSEKNRLEETKNDKNLKEIKGKIETKEEKTEQVKDTSLEENKESKENKENKEIKQTQNSLMDELINKAKGEITNKETAKEDLKKEPKIENQNKFEIEQKVINPKKEEATKTEKVEIKAEKVEIKAEIKPEAKKEVGLENRVEAKELKEEAKTEKVEIKSEIKIDLNSEKVEKSGAKIEINKESGNLKNLDEKALVKVEQKDEVKQESPKPKSLMDELLKTKETKTISGDAITSSPKEANKNSDFLTNIYLGAQKNSIYNQMLSSKSEGVKTVKEGESLEDIKKGAEKLELNPKDLSLKKEEKSSNSSTSKVDSKLQENKDSENNQLETKHVEKKVQRDSIDRMIFDQNAKRTISSSEAVLSNSIENKQEQSVSLSVSPTLALSIQNRIIGAQQQMSSMMSDIARNMYENYKPPITAFRINLFPAQLGQIAILMKSENNGSGLSISMNMSNAATLDAVIENQSSLREAINRNFDNQTDVSFDFGMQSENQGGSFSQNNQEQQQKEQHSSSEIIETVNENKNLTDDLNYF